MGVAGGATRAAMTQHQARRDNMADVAAKDGSQVRCKIFRWSYYDKANNHICKCCNYTHVVSELIISTFCFHIDRETHDLMGQFLDVKILTWLQGLGE